MNAIFILLNFASSRQRELGKIQIFMQAKFKKPSFQVHHDEWAEIWRFVAMEIKNEFNMNLNEDKLRLLISFWGHLSLSPHQIDLEA